jgi:hypothetical protein
MVSNVGDGWAEQFPNKWPQFQPPYVPPPEVSKQDFDALRKEVQELKELLKAAKKFDKNTGQPDCEMEKKIELIKAVAKMVGVDLDGVI